MDLNQYNDKINSDLSWRKKEISNLWSFINEITNDNNEKLKDIQYRAFILLLYSHLEWFVKKWWGLYLEYISKLNKKFSDLQYSFYETYFSRQYKSWKKLKDLMGSYKDIAIFYYWKQDINTRSNINTNVLINLLYQFWIDFSMLEEKFRDRIKEGWFSYLDEESIDNPNSTNFCLKDYLIKVLDKSLLEKRNWIAHGEKRNIDLKELNIFKELVLSLLDSMYGAFYDSLEQEQYLIKQIKTNAIHLK